METSLIRSGYFHLKNGSYSREFIANAGIDGVYITSGIYITNIERDGKTKLSRAKRFCANRDVVLPNREERNIMIANREAINSSLRAIGFIPIKDDEYWALDDEAGESIPGDAEFHSSPDIGGDYITGGYGEFVPYKKNVRGCLRG